jgi:hypothetical protein
MHHLGNIIQHLLSIKHYFVQYHVLQGLPGSISITTWVTISCATLPSIEPSLSEYHEQPCYVSCST